MQAASALLIILVAKADLKIGIFLAMPKSMRAVFALMICASLGSIFTSSLAAQKPLSVPEALALRTIANPNMGLGFVAFNMVVPRPIEDGPGGSYLNIGYIENPLDALAGKAL